MTAPSIRLPTGHQYEIGRGTAVAKVGSVAAVLREFTVDGVDFIEKWDDALPSPYGNGIVLVPWPNRIRDGRWTLDGKQLTLDLSDRSTGNASHGLLRNTSYELVSVDDSAVTLGATVYPQHGYPFTLDTFVTYALLDDGLHVTHRLVNVGTGKAPFGVGAHPYLRVGNHPIGSLAITLDAATSLMLDGQKLPIGAVPVAGTPVDLRHGPLIGDVDLDTAYTDLAAVGREYQTTLTAPDNTGVVLWQDHAFGYTQVFTPRDYPGRDLTVAVEPMTCPADAFNTGDGLRWLEPGEEFTGSWGLRPF